MAITHKRYTTLNELKVLNKREGIFISGGDQLWNSYHPCGKDDAYKLTFISNYPKLAYGTSMGRDSYTKNEIIELVQKIKDFKSIGLRESCSVKQLFNTKLKDIVYHAADPVLLLQKNEYKKFIGKRRIKEPYVLMYLTAKSDLLEQTINYISINKKLKVVHVSGFRKKCICDYFLKSTGPEDLLNLIYFADYVVSASFHATIFSIIFHKQFSTLLPEEGTNARIEDILKYVGLSNRIIHKKKDIISCNSEINFTNSDKKLENLIKKSKAIFLSALKKYSI